MSDDIERTAADVSADDASDGDNELTTWSIDSRRFAWLVVLCIGLVALADWLFWDAPCGWTLGAYGFVLTATLLLWERPFGNRRVAVLITLAIVLLWLQCVEEPTAVGLAFGVLGLATLGLLAREGWCANFVTWALRWMRLAAFGWGACFLDVNAWHRSQGATNDPRERTQIFLRNWTLAIVLGAVFAGLFTFANPVISRWLSDAWHELHHLLRHLTEHLPSGWRILMWMTVGLATWAMLRGRSGLKPSTPAGETAASTPSTSNTAAAIVVRSLVVFNVVFAVQTVLDLYYLWGGAALPRGLTYAQYAHRGAYPLVAAALLAAIFVLAAFRTHSRDRSMLLARRLVYVWLAQNLLLVVSAGWRLGLYVDAYALSRWRVAAAIWMLLVFCGLAWILVRIVARRSNLWLINVNAVTTLVVLYACCFVNFDGFIADYNVAHCEQVRGFGPPIDIVYLEHLGPEALPALAVLAAAVENTCEQEGVDRVIARLRVRLDRQLESWRGWTWRRQRLQRVESSAVR